MENEYRVVYHVSNKHVLRIHLSHDVRNAFSTLFRTTFYKWLKRYQKDGLKGLLDIPKTPLRKRAPTVRKKYELDIIRIRNNNPTWSKEKIAIERWYRILLRGLTRE